MFDPVGLCVMAVIHVLCVAHGSKKEKEEARAEEVRWTQREKKNKKPVTRK